MFANVYICNIYVTEMCKLDMVCDKYESQLLSLQKLLLLMKQFTGKLVNVSMLRAVVLL